MAIASAAVADSASGCALDKVTQECLLLLLLVLVLVPTPVRVNPSSGIIATA